MHYKKEAVEQRGLNGRHAHAEMTRHRTRKVVVESDYGCNDKDLTHSDTDVPAEDVGTKKSRPSDAGCTPKILANWIMWISQ